jgi:hypothetical protein
MYWALCLSSWQRRRCGQAQIEVLARTSSILTPLLLPDVEGLQLNQLVADQLMITLTLRTTAPAARGGPLVSPLDAGQEGAFTGSYQSTW